MAKDSVTRFTLTLPKVTKDLIERLAAQNGTSSSAMMQDLIETGLTVEAIRAENGELIARINGREIVVAGPHGVLKTDRRRLTE